MTAPWWIVIWGVKWGGGGSSLVDKADLDRGKCNFCIFLPFMNVLLNYVRCFQWRVAKRRSIMRDMLCRTQFLLLSADPVSCLVHPTHGELYGQETNWVLVCGIAPPARLSPVNPEDLTEFIDHELLQWCVCLMCQSHSFPWVWRPHWTLGQVNAPNTVSQTTAPSQCSRTENNNHS